MKNGVIFSEILLWRILDTLIACLEILQRKGRRLGDIRPCNLYLSKQEESLKILYTNYAKTAFDLILAKKLPYYRCFLAPEQLELVGEKRPNEKSCDLMKCEIFSIATMVLSVSCHHNKDRIYNIQEPGLLFSGINNKLSWFKANYSNILASLLEQMISVNENLRPSLMELRVHINQNLKNQLSFRNLPSESIIPKHHTTFNSFDSNIMLNYEKNTNFDSLSLQRILNDSKSTKRTDKTTISINSKEILQMESKDNSSLQRSLELKDANNPNNIGIQEKDLRTGSVLIAESEKKIPFFEKIKRTELISQKSTANHHKRNVSEVPYVKKPLQVLTKLSQGQNLMNSLETSLEDETRIQKLIGKLEKKLIYEKNNPTILNPNMQKIQYADGSIYIGTLKDGSRDGKGIYYFSQREVYGGDWKDDQFEGHGIYIYDNGDIYEGNLKAGLKQGKGIYYYTNGNKYDGEWLENQKNGFGIFYFNNGSEKFEGFWSKNEKAGPGVYYFASGDKFEGNWKNGLKSGKGIVYFSDNSSFEGIWEDNMPQGHGILHYSNGDTYEGSFLYGSKEGEGVYKHEAGSKYEGTWRNDEQTGKGMIIYANGDKYQGGMMNGLRFGFGIYWYSSGEKYEGEWKENQRWGNGKLILSKKSYYEGIWAKGKRNGYGVMIFENEEKYEGCWREDKKDGKGAYIWKNGTAYKGNWKDDKMNAEGRYVDEFGMEIYGLWLNGEFWEKC